MPAKIESLSLGEKKTVRVYSVILRGIIGRKRKPDTHAEDFLTLDADAARPDDLEKQARECLASLKARPGTIFRVVSLEHTFENKHGYTTRSCSPFDSKLEVPQQTL